MYKSTAFGATDQSILFLGAENKLYYPQSGASIGAQRAYFKIGDGAALARQLTAFNLNFGDGNTTGIENVQCSMFNRPPSGTPSTDASSTGNPRAQACILIMV